MNNVQLYTGETANDCGTESLFCVKYTRLQCGYMKRSKMRKGDWLWVWRCRKAKQRAKSIFEPRQEGEWGYNWKGDEFETMRPSATKTVRERRAGWLYPEQTDNIEAGFGDWTMTRQVDARKSRDWTNVRYDAKEYVRMDGVLTKNRAFDHINDRRRAGCERSQYENRVICS